MSKKRKSFDDIDETEVKNEQGAEDADIDDASALQASEETDLDDDSEEGRHKKKKKKKDKKKNKKQNDKPEHVNIVKELRFLIIYIGSIVLLCYLIITFVGCRAKVDGSSMNPTLENNDSLWVDKLSYTIGDPKRFDIIIFKYDNDTDYVKRIIGLPGEKVRIDQNGNIYINEVLLEENYGKEVILPSKIGRAGQNILLGHDEYFVLGDNRNNSSDSRFADVGNIKREDIVGKARLRIYPFNKIGIVK